jgi:hypothetical protein
MRRGVFNSKIQNITIAASLSLLIFLSVTLGQSGGPYVLEWSTIDGGGGVSRGGQYIVSGTIGQPDAGVSSGGGYELLGGFWSAAPLCTVDFRHFARFAEYWLETGSDLPADLYEDDIVDELDLELFVDKWLCYCPYDWPLK